MPDQPEYNLAAIRQLLLDTFPGQPQDLLRFCKDHPLFQPIVLHFGHKYSLLEMIDEVVDYCQAHLLLEELEAELRTYTPPQRQLLPEAYSPLPPPDADELPEPGRLPPGSRLPFGRNALFTGRERPLKALAQALLQGEPGSTLITQAIQGMGGIGKTQLAVEFAYRYGRFFHGVHWLDCAKPESIHAEIAACGEEMRLQPWPRELPDQVELTLDAWTQDGRRHLVVLDNLEDPKAGGPWLQRLQATGAALLVTSRERRWPKHLGLAPLRIRVFSQEESRAFLRQYLPESRAAEADLDALAEKVGSLPLALELAGCYLDRAPTLPVAAFLEHLETVLDHQGMQNLLEELGHVAGYERGLVQCFGLSWDEVKAPAARRLFRVAGNCAPNQPIPCDLLAAALGLDEEACAVALGQLTGLGLLDLADPDAGPTLHPLLAEFARALPPEEDFDPLAALAAALAPMAYETNMTGRPALFTPLRPHLEAAAPAAEESDAATAATLWTNLGYHRNMIADYAGARTAYERALEIGEATLGPDHTKIAVRLNNLGSVLKALGDLPAARQHFERALEIDGAAFGPGHSKVATRLNNLGMVLQALGDLPAARQHLERALEIDQAAFGPGHSNVARDLSNLGTVLQALGDLSAARQHFERTLEMFEKLLGPDHPSVATSVNNLGNVLQDLGDLPAARQHFERALEIWKEALGDSHPQVATATSNLARVLKDLGDLPAARQHLERALEIDEAAFGPDHPNVARDLNNLSYVLEELDELPAARAYAARALAIREKVLPAEHPSIQFARKHLLGLDFRLEQDG